MNTQTQHLRAEKVRTMAHAIMQRHGLLVKGWRFQFDNARKREGHCKFHEQLITIPKHYAIHGSFAENQDTILHEVAHAIAGWWNGHNETWRMVAKQINCSGEEFGFLEVDKPKYKKQCRRNCWSDEVSRKTNAQCYECGDIVVYLPMCRHGICRAHGPIQIHGLGFCAEHAITEVMAITPDITTKRAAIDFIKNVYLEAAA